MPSARHEHAHAGSRDPAVNTDLAQRESAEEEPGVAVPTSGQDSGETARTAGRGGIAVLGAKLFFSSPASSSNRSSGAPSA